MYENTSKMRIGIIGTGVMGKHHLRIVDSIPELQLTCAMDHNSEHLDSACSPYKIQKFNDYKNMVNSVDAVMIATPTISHYEIGKYFLEKKKNILIEKPITSTLEQADELINIAKKNNLTIAVGHMERFNPVVEYVNKLVKKPVFIEIQRLGSFSPRSLDVDVIMDLMIHDLDIILQWDQSGIKQINASGLPIISQKTDIANVRLQFNSGLVANITASRVSQKKTRKLRIFQKYCYFSIDYKKKRLKKYSLQNGEIKEEIPEIEQIEPLYNFWVNFYKTLTTGKNYNVTAEDARDALRIALLISDHIKKNIEI
jgi:predicted dehydrogenase